MKTKIFALVAMAVWLAVACKDQTKPDKKADGITSLDIPLQMVKRSQDYNDLERIPYSLGLTSLRQRSDSIIVRLWFVYGNIDSSQLVTLRLGHWGWEAGSSLFTYHIDNNYRSTLSIDNETRMEPKSGWDVFMDSLMKLHIMTLPDMNKSLGHPKTAGDDDVIIEVSSKKGGYAIYRYRNPALSQGENKNAERMENIMELIETELGFKRLRKF